MHKSMIWKRVDNEPITPEQQRVMVFNEARNETGYMDLWRQCPVGHVYDFVGNGADRILDDTPTLEGHRFKLHPAHGHNARGFAVYYWISEAS